MMPFWLTTCTHIILHNISLNISHYLLFLSLVFVFICPMINYQADLQLILHHILVKNMIIYYNYKQQQSKKQMRLDPSYLHFITKQQLRILVAIEIGMRNHQYVPMELIIMIGNLKAGETYKTVRKLLKNKFIVHVGNKNNGYKLTYLGYDYLAIHTFMKRGVIKDVICKIGVGKQSDIYKCQTPDGTHVVLKLTRLGRRSFRTIKNNRQYIQNRTSFNWLYLSRLSSMREFVFMQVLHEDGFPTPKPIDTNRHAIVMSLIDADPLCHIRKIGQHCSARQIFIQSLKLVQKFATRGLIHGDFNEFNLMINQNGELTVIDFPQCISSHHVNAEQYFNRDVQCLYRFFEKMMQKCHRVESDGEVRINQKDLNFNVSQIPMPVLSEIQIVKRLDKQVLTKGHIKLSEEKQLQQYQRGVQQQEQKERIEGQESDSEQGQQDSADEQEMMQEQNQNQEEQTANKQQKTEEQEIQEIKKQYKLSADEGDDEMRQLIDELNELNTKKNQEEGQEESSGEEQQTGPTAYQIRQKLKQQKLLQRQKKKAQMSSQEYIKKALYKKNKRAPISKGNYGAKNKAKSNAQSIKDGLQMGW